MTPPHPRYKTRMWRVVRAAVLRRDAYQCQLRIDGCTGLATECDHVVRPEDGGDEFHTDNLQASCKHCNVSKRNSELAKRARGYPPMRKW